jgi:thiol-disulfide isomerase/thioredoxin
MKKMLQSVAMGIAMLICQNSYSQKLQQPINLSKLKIQGVTNYSSTEFMLSDFGAKLIILDFWGPRCLSCIEAFSKMDALQKEFGNRIQIIMVNQESKEFTEQFFAKRKKLFTPQLPFVMGDTILKKIFPHEGMPYHVWIDSLGNAISTTDGYQSNRVSIKAYLEKNMVQITDARPRRNSVPSLFDKKFDSSLEYYSYIAHCNQGFRIQDNIDRQGIHLTQTCTDIKSLYIMAYSEGGKFELDRPGRCVLNLPNDRIYKVPNDPEKIAQWRANDSYTYDLFLPAWRREEAYTIMKQDLGRYFRLHARVEKRKIKTLALIRTSQSDQLRSKGGKGEDQFYNTHEGSTEFAPARFIRNLEFDVLVYKLKWIFETEMHQSFTDLTGYRGPIDFCVDGNVMDDFNLKSFRHALNAYDLDLVEKCVEADVLVIDTKRK